MFEEDLLCVSTPSQNLLRNFACFPFALGNFPYGWQASEYVSMIASQISIHVAACTLMPVQSGIEHNGLCPDDNLQLHSRIWHPYTISDIDT
jgi:hypothetical protein